MRPSARCALSNDSDTQRVRVSASMRRRLSRLLIAMVAMACLAEASRADDAKWFGEPLPAILGVQASSETTPGPWVSPLRDLAGAERPASMLHRDIDTVTEAVLRDFRSDEIVSILASVPLNARANQPNNLWPLGQHERRKIFYKEMFLRADALRPTDPDKAARIQRAATLLSLVDFRGSVVSVWLYHARENPDQLLTLNLSDENLKALKRVMDEIQASHIATGTSHAFISSLPEAYAPNADGKPNRGAMVKSAELGVADWRESPGSLAGRQSVARELWRLRCLADADLDEAGRQEVRAVLERLANYAADPASQKWAIEVLTLPGPRPQRPGSIIVTPDDLKPKRPD